jgi:hypothetical protein
MRLGTVEEYIKDSFLETPSALERALALEDTLISAELSEQFPFLAIVEASYPEWDVAHRWCWQTFGPRHGTCDWTTEYPACPIILTAEKNMTKVVRAGIEYEHSAYSNPVEHSHVGLWTTYWFGKTNYNHGFGAFCFSNESDMSRFITHVPNVDFGEHYT